MSIWRLWKRVNAGLEEEEPMERELEELIQSCTSWTIEIRIVENDKNDKMTK
jgi:hypothetical protein